MMNDEDWMREALILAERAEEEGEVPVGAVLVLDNKIIGRGWNRSIQMHDPSAHAEVMALRDAGQFCANYRFPGATLYVTLEPCTMCAGVIVHSRIERLVYAASDPKTGVIESTENLLDLSCHNHKVVYQGGTLSGESSQLLKNFFVRKRNLNKTK